MPTINIMTIDLWPNPERSGRLLISKVAVSNNIRTKNSFLISNAVRVIKNTIIANDNINLGNILRNCVVALIINHTNTITNSAINSLLL